MPAWVGCAWRGRVVNGKWKTPHERAVLESICTKCSLENVCIAALNVIQNTCRVVEDLQGGLLGHGNWVGNAENWRGCGRRVEAMTDWRKSKKINKGQIVVGKQKCASFSLYANCEMCDEVDGSFTFSPFHPFCNLHEWIQILGNVCTTSPNPCPCPCRTFPLFVMCKCNGWQKAFAYLMLLRYFAWHTKIYVCMRQNSQTFSCPTLVAFGMRIFVIFPHKFHNNSVTTFWEPPVVRHSVLPFSHLFATVITINNTIIVCCQFEFTPISRLVSSGVNIENSQ